MRQHEDTVQMNSTVEEIPSIFFVHPSGKIKQHLVKRLKSYLTNISDRNGACPYQKILTDSKKSLCSMVVKVPKWKIEASRLLILSGPQFLS